MTNVKEEFQEAWEICKLLKTIPIEDKLRLQGMMMLLKEQNKENTVQQSKKSRWISHRLLYCVF